MSENADSLNEGKTKNTKKKKKKFFKRLVIVIIIFPLIAYVAAVNLMVSAALMPEFMKKLSKFEEVTEEAYSQQVVTDELSLNYQSEWQLTYNWLEQVDQENVHLTSRDGYDFDAQVYAPVGEDLRWADSEADGGDKSTGKEQSHKWVLLLHGYTGWKEEMYRFACWYSLRGYNCVVPDLRASGESGGAYIGMGATDRYDALLWLGKIMETDPDAEIVIHGQSMGAATALMMSGLPEIDRYPIKAIVSDCAYQDAATMFMDKAKEWFHVPGWVFVPGAAVALKVRAGYWLYDASALDAVKQSRIPTIFIHGNRDAMIGVSQCYTLYNEAICEKEMLIVDNAGHAQAPEVDPVQYFGRIAAFLERYQM